jgi:hypothetical protein
MAQRASPSGDIQLVLVEKWFSTISVAAFFVGKGSQKERTL